MKTLFIFLCLLMGAGAFAQDSLLVYHLNGKAFLARENKRQPLKIGSKFSANGGRLEIDKGSSVTLISSSFQAKEFTRSATMIDVKKSFGVQKKTDVTGKYFAYVWSQFTHPHGSPEADRRKYMSNAGGVARGCPGVQTSIPDTIFYTGRPLRLRWASSLPAGRLHFNINRKGLPPDSTVRMKVDTAVSMDMLREQMKAGVKWNWSLQIDKQHPCTGGVIVYVTPEKFKIKEKELRDQLPKADPARTALMLAFMLESYGYLDAAEEYYLTASRLAEGNH